MTSYFLKSIGEYGRRGRVRFGRARQGAVGFGSAGLVRLGWAW